MEADLLQEGFLLSTALMAWMAEEGPRLPMAPFPDQDYGGDRGGRGPLQIGFPQLLMQEQAPRDHTTLKVPKVEQTAGSDLPVAAMEIPSPSDLDCTTRKRPPPDSHPVPLPLTFPSPVPVTLHLPSSFIDPRTLGDAARPAPQQLIPPNTRSRVRRKGISERMRLLAKLMPWDRKMTTSAMLEEARNYVKFLEAQVAALQCMPVEPRVGCFPPSAYAAAAPLLRGLEKLTRQQLLHVLVRSPLVQDKLCAGGLCVFATEQVNLIRQAAQANKTLQQQQQPKQQTALDSASTSTISD